MQACRLRAVGPRTTKTADQSCNCASISPARGTTVWPAADFMEQARLYLPPIHHTELVKFLRAGDCYGDEARPSKYAR